MQSAINDSKFSLPTYNIVTKVNKFYSRMKNVLYCISNPQESNLLFERISGWFKENVFCLFTRKI